MTIPTEHVADAGDLRKLGDRPSLLLSASVPYLFTVENTDPQEHVHIARWNKLYVDAARPAKIRAAVMALTRVALSHGLRLVFGAHSSISPTVLQAAQDMGAPPRSILIVQSQIYQGKLPQSTLDLANWHPVGLLVMTRAQPEQRDSVRNPNSLRFMREMMVRVPGLLGAVFVGGMLGVEAEADAFAQAPPPARKRYAVSSTGSAAEVLADRDPAGFHGTLSDPAPLRHGRSYSVVARRIVNDLLSAPSGVGTP